MFNYYANVRLVHVYRSNSLVSCLCIILIDSKLLNFQRCDTMLVGTHRQQLEEERSRSVVAEKEMRRVHQTQLQTQQMEHEVNKKVDSYMH